ncbi:MAG: SulP family inorganic anion transporter, partial [Saprospiraceae bacterium]|nr:SulP family inorganic anion transporter [Saprospiraceae bacterium]
FLANFLSHPIMMGFTSAAALIIAVSQLKTFLGIDIPRSMYVHDVLIAAVRQVSEINPITVLLGVGALVIMEVCRRLRKGLPGALIAVVVLTLAVYLFGWHARGVDVVGDVPKGLPGFAVPSLDWPTIQALFSLALTLTFLQMIETISIAKAVEAERKDHRVNANQELIALGLSKIVGAFFQAYPTSGSFTRTAVNHKAGARTGLSSVVTGVLVMITLLLLTPLFKHMPKAVFAAIIIMAVSSLFKWREARQLYHTHRADFAMLLATFLSTLFLGVMPGVIIGILLSLIVMIYRTSTPHVCELGRIPDTQHYRNPHRFPEVIIDDDILIVRFDAQLYFGNANFFRQKMEELVLAKGAQLKLVVLDARSMTALDTSAELALREVMQFLRTRGIRFNLAGATGPMRDSLYRTGLMEQIGEENQFMLVDDAVQHYRTDADNVDHWSENALQTNISNDH